VNGYKFQTKDQSQGMQTCNSGVCVKFEGTDVTTYWYGVLEEIVEYCFTNDPDKKVVLFKCDWYDPTPSGTKTDKQFKLVEVNEGRRYRVYDPFIFAHQACQVYYTSFPEGHRGWKSVVRIAARSVVDEESLQLAAVQDDEIIGVNVEDTDVDCHLRDPDGDDEPINVGAAQEEEEEESCSSGRSDDENADENEDDADD
jgi:hypothetical protein